VAKLTPPLMDCVYLGDYMGIRQAYKWMLAYRLKQKSQTRKT